MNLFALLAKVMEWEKQCQELKINSRNFHLRGLLCDDGTVIPGPHVFRWCVSNGPPVWGGGF